MTQFHLPFDAAVHDEAPTNGPGDDLAEHDTAAGRPVIWSRPMGAYFTASGPESLPVSRLTPKQLDCGWIDYKPGDPQPVGSDIQVEFVYEDGAQSPIVQTIGADWTRAVAYRLVFLDDYVTIAEPPVPTMVAAKAQLEVDLLTRALRQTNGNATKAAALLDISRPTVYRLMRVHNLQRTTNVEVRS